MKFGQNLISGLGGDVEEIVYGCSDGHTTDDRQNVITKTHLVTM